jgi:hypothetical protein
MSKRPIEAKQRRRVAKALRRQPVPAYFDLITWLMDHGHASTKRQARKLILAKRVRANSHVLGVKSLPMQVPAGPLGAAKIETQDVVMPHVSADLRPDLVVLEA